MRRVVDHDTFDNKNRCRIAHLMQKNPHSISSVQLLHRNVTGYDAQLPVRFCKMVCSQNHLQSIIKTFKGCCTPKIFSSKARSPSTYLKRGKTMTAGGVFFIFCKIPNQNDPSFCWEFRIFRIYCTCAYFDEHP